ncbi:hypothetical protein [Pseudomonas nitroreducens]|uniref:hypothetical protein n=1 Tax=Pseudomonas nitroreducens TaxID=46680 RepID=UPI0028AB4569|nr:hypothetical protein [Pseudomonas nitroreducens]
MLDKSAFQRSTEALIADPHAHYMAQAEQALFHTEALDLIRRLKTYADRAASPIAHELCTEACEFIAKHTRKAA